MTAISATAISVWTIRRNANMSDFLQEKGGRRVT